MHDLLVSVFITSTSHTEFMQPCQLGLSQKKKKKKREKEKKKKEEAAV